ncbi:MAG: 4-hydroxythreonine-4-phosphate dehydrogenase PdxA, partial [Burkholderiaceae bacterium]
MADTAASAARRPRLAVTCGEPAGIGPEISLRAAWQLRGAVRGVLIGDAAFLSLLAREIDPAMRLVALSPQALRNDGLPEFGDDRLAVVDCPLAAHVTPGRLDAANGRAVLRTLDVAIDGALAGTFDAIVTAPLQKSTLNDAGVPFTGHTEYLAERTGTPRVVMMLAGPMRDAADAGLTRPLRVALATTHLPLKDVPAAIMFDGLLETLTIVDEDLRGKFGIARPRILVTGLNPHAGEGGYLGREEIDVVSPALDAARTRGIDAAGPYPADTLFQPKYLENADCVLAMYHDQGLPV